MPNPSDASEVVVTESKTATLIAEINAALAGYYLCAVPKSEANLLRLVRQAKAALETKEFCEDCEQGDDLRAELRAMHAARPAPEPLDIGELRRAYLYAMGEQNFFEVGWEQFEAVCQLAHARGASLDEIVAAAKGASQ